MRKIEPFKLTKMQVVYMLGVEERTVTNWENRGEDPMPVEVKGGKRGMPNVYDPYEILKWKVQQEVRRLAPAGSDGEILDANAEKARLNKEQADAAAIKNAVTRKELAPVSILEKAAADAAAQIGSVLDSIPVKLKNRVPGMTATGMEMIKTEIARAKNAAASISVKL